MTDQSVVDALRSGRWRERSGRPLARRRGPLPWPEVAALVTPGPLLGLALLSL